MKVFYWCIILFLLNGCNPQNKELIQVVKYWKNKEIIFPDHLKMKIYGKDTLDKKFLSHKYKILNYIDTNGCNECQLKFYEWKLLSKQIDSLKLNTSITFVIFANNYHPIEKSQILNNFNIPILYDSLGMMGKLNNFSFNPKYKTFLLNSSNHVIAIGNPIHNKKVWELYKEKINLHK